jgi:hypothetical protein
VPTVIFGLALLQTIVEVPALNVIFVAVVKSTAFAPLIVIVEEPKFMVLVLLVSDNKLVTDTL